MRILLAALIVMAALVNAAWAQTAREITFFSNEGFSGARFTVTGPREILDLPYKARSAMIQGGGSWQLCAGRGYKGPCQTISQDQRNLHLGIGRIASLRPAAVATSPWREIGRLHVRDRAETDSLHLAGRERYREVMLCAERNTVRIRRAEVQLGGGDWQRLFVPVALAPGKCSNAVDLFGEGRRIRSFQFSYEAWTLGKQGATLVIRALPFVKPQPR